MEKRSFVCVVVGQYYALAEVSGTPTIRNYTATFTLPTQEAALSTICKHLLAPYLKKHYSDFIRFRTHQLKSITVVGRKPNPAVLQMDINDMTVSELSDFCILKEIMIDPYRHSDLPKVREQIIEAYRAKRVAEKEKRESNEAKEKEEVDELLKQNELPPTSDGPQINVNEQKVLNQKSSAHKEGPGVPAFVEPSDEALPPEESDGGID